MMFSLLRTSLSSPAAVITTSLKHQFDLKKVFYISSSTASAASATAAASTVIDGKMPRKEIKERVKETYVDPHHKWGDIHAEEDLVLQSGVVIPKNALHIRYSTWGNPSLPAILICPSMSNSPFVIDTNVQIDGKEVEKQGWWNPVVGPGPRFGIDTTKFHVICGAALGAPFGTTSPLSINPKTGKRWGPKFPQITPRDMATVQAMLLKLLGIKKVHAVVGGSMGGMQVIQFAALFPELYDNFIAIAATAHTSPSTVALRSVQRAAVRMDPRFKDGWYEPGIGKGPTEGMSLARKIGTIVYRSRKEFDIRFNWLPQIERNNKFEVEDYLDHQAHKFTRLVGYDANCYLLLSQAMDMMNVGASFGGFEQGVSRIPADKHGLLLSYDTDVLTPPGDLERFASALGQNKVNVHFEVLHSKYGHDAFLIEHEASPLIYRIRAFLGNPHVPTPNQIPTRHHPEPVDRVREIVRELHDQ